MFRKNPFRGYRLIALPVIALGICFSPVDKTGSLSQYAFSQKPTPNAPARDEENFYTKLAAQAEKRLLANVTYDGSYRAMTYPMGDVPAHIGVCSDVVIRSYRGVGIDLQERVHRDMKKHFAAYPTKWGLKKPDTNIDHRRVLNLMTFFKRAGAALPITDAPADYRAGNIVAWDLADGLTHIGIVSTQVSKESGNPLIVHNIGAGPVLEDMLFEYKIIGHYRYGAGKK